MIFKILSAEIRAGSLQVAVKHDECIREVFSYPVEWLENDKYLDVLVDTFNKREEQKRRLGTAAATASNHVGKEFDTTNYSLKHDMDTGLPLK